MHNFSVVVISCSHIQNLFITGFLSALNVEMHIQPLAVLKPADSPTDYANCCLNHPAKYKGCLIYRQLTKTNKSIQNQNPNKTSTSSSNTNFPNKKYNFSKYDTELMFYVQVVKSHGLVKSVPET